MVIGRRSQDVQEHDLSVADLAAPIRRDLSVAGLKVNQEHVRDRLEDLENLLSRRQIADFPQLLLKKNGWVLEDPSMIRLFDRIMDTGKPLGEHVDDRIYMGVKTGFNKAFVLDQEKRDDLVAEDPNSADIIKPWLRGKDIRRWTVDSEGLYILFMNRGVEIEKYPAVEEHLSWYRDDLERRATAHLHPWYELQQPQEGFYREFERPKIIWPDITREMRFALDRNGSYLDMTGFTVPGESAWLLAFMNSALSEFILCQITSSLRGGFLRPKRQYMTQLPIVVPAITTQAELQVLVGQVCDGTQLEKQMHTIENEIDAIVFDIYRVRASERKLVLDWVSERRETLGREVDPEWRKLNALKSVSGAWKDSVDGDQLKRDIRASRELNTRPVPRL